MASAPRRGHRKSQAFRVAISVIFNTYYGREAIRGALDYAMSHARWDIHHEGGSEALAFRRFEAAIDQWSADGALAQITHQHVVDTILAARIPAVDIWSQFDSGIPSMRADDQAIGRLGAKYFMERVFRNFAWLTYRADDVQAFVRRRRDAYVDTLAKHGFTCHVYEYSPRAGAKTDWFDESTHARSWLASLPKPVAVMSCHDYRAGDIIRACVQAGLRVPEDVAVLGVDNDSLECSLCKPWLSSVIIPFRELGYQAAKLLDSMLNGAPSPKEPILVKPLSVATRQSSDTLAVDDPELAAAARYISENASRPISVDDVLAAVPLSRRTLERRFLETFGRSPREHILRAHVAEAKRLLENTSMKLSTIAQRSGFTQTQRFSRLFKGIEGVAPADYRAHFHAGIPAGGSSSAD